MSKNVFWTKTEILLRLQTGTGFKFLISKFFIDLKYNFF